MKRILRLKSVLFFVPMLVFFCQYDNGNFCFGNNDGAMGDGNPVSANTGAGSNFALGNDCPAEFPDANEPF